MCPCQWAMWLLDVTLCQFGWQQMPNSWPKLDGRARWIDQELRVSKTMMSSSNNVKACSTWYCNVICHGIRHGRAFWLYFVKYLHLEDLSSYMTQIDMTWYDIRYIWICCLASIFYRALSRSRGQNQRLKDWRHAKHCKAQSRIQFSWMTKFSDSSRMIRRMMSEQGWDDRMWRFAGQSRQQCGLRSCECCGAPVHVGRPAQPETQPDLRARVTDWYVYCILLQFDKREWVFFVWV